MSTAANALQLMQPHLLQPFVEALDEKHANINKLLDSLELNRESIIQNEGMVTARQVQQFLRESAIVAGDPLFNWKIGWNMNHMDYPLFSGLFEAGIDLGQFFTRMAMYSASQATATRFELHIEGGYTRFVSIRLYKSEPAPEVDAFGAGMLLSLIRKFVGKALKPTQASVEVNNPNLIPPSAGCHRIASARHTQTSIRFPTTWLLARYGQKKIHQIPATPHDPPKNQFTQHIRNSLQRHVGDSKLTTLSAARHCGGSVYTIDKQLKKEGTGLSKLINALRCELACEELKKTNHRISDIGAHIGYPDPTSFTRAFLRWTGMSPRDFRKSP